MPNAADHAAGPPTIAEFGSMADVETYLEHPAHVAAVNDALPLLATVVEHDHTIG